jgi:acetyl-CoA acetyltransferase
MSALSGKTAVAGIGATPFSKNSGRSELQLALEAIVDAVNDAGLSIKDIDGLVTFDMDTSQQVDVSRNLGLTNVTFVSSTPFGGGLACATVQHACLAVAAGVANTVVCYRAFNERSGNRFASGENPIQPHSIPTASEVRWGWHAPHGIFTPASTIAVCARRYMHEYGATSEDFGRVSVLLRAHAAANPKAWFYKKPITLADHQASRMVVDPVRLLDCCQETDGGVAIIVTSTERARDLKKKPVIVKAAAQAMGDDQEVMTSYYRESITSHPEAKAVAAQLWKQSGLKQGDMDVLVLYDHFTPFVLLALEEYGFCKPGEAPGLIRSGALALDGKWPLNPHGGLIGEAYIHGLNNISEGVRQVRGEAVNQIEDAKNVLVTAGNGVPTSGLILGNDR